MKLKINRIQRIEDYIKQNETVTNETLCDMFNISMQTLRRDLKILVDADKIDKVYGGVIYKPKSLLNHVQSINQREQLNAKEKAYIGQLAARLVENGDVIYIDSGTTAYHLISNLTHHKNVTIMTHSLEVVNRAVSLKHCSCVCLGGLLRKDTLSFSIDLTNKAYSYKMAFIGTVGLCEEGLTNTDINEGKIKEYVIRQSEKVFVVADHTKFDHSGFYHFADLKDCAGIITDRKPNDKLINHYNKLGITLYY